MSLKMSEEEENVFEALNKTLSAISEQLGVTNDTLAVIAIELYEARRDLTDIFKKMNTILGTLAKTEFVPEVKEVSAVQEAAPFKELVFPKSTLPKAEEATE